ncbi:hypothetical protein ACR0VG_000453 [Citrobacter freundii]
MTNESSANAIIGNTLRIIASGEYHPGAELTQKMASYIIELEQKLTDMAVQLANAESKCRELAAENVTLNDKMNRLATWPGIEFYSSSWEFCNLDGNDALEFMCDVQTPATDAFLAEVRAQGLESGVNTVIAMMNHQHPAASQAIDILKTHAAQLRKGVQP